MTCNSKGKIIIKLTSHCKEVLEMDNFSSIQILEKEKSLQEKNS